MYSESDSLDQSERMNLTNILNKLSIKTKIVIIINCRPLLFIFIIVLCNLGTKLTKTFQEIIFITNFSKPNLTMTTIAEPQVVTRPMIVSSQKYLSKIENFQNFLQNRETDTHMITSDSQMLKNLCSPTSHIITLEMVSQNLHRQLCWCIGNTVRSKQRILFLIWKC